MPFNLRRLAERKCQKLPDRQASGLSPWRRAVLQPLSLFLLQAFCQKAVQKSKRLTSPIYNSSSSPFILLAVWQKALKLNFCSLLTSPLSFIFFFFVPLFYWWLRMASQKLESRQSAWNPMLTKKKFPKKTRKSCKVFLSSLSSSKQSLYLLAASCHSVFLNTSVSCLQNECATSLTSMIANAACMQLQLERD